MSAAICGIDANEDPGCRCAHPGYACLIVLGSFSEATIAVVLGLRAAAAHMG